MVRMKPYCLKVQLLFFKESILCVPKIMEISVRPVYCPFSIINIPSHFLKRFILFIFFLIFFLCVCVRVFQLII